jgi:hypothetical protein
MRIANRKNRKENDRKMAEASYRTVHDDERSGDGWGGFEAATF